MTKESQKRRTNENVNKINEEMRKKEKGLTLAEKIEKLIEKVKKTPLPPVFNTNNLKELTLHELVQAEKDG